MFLVIYILYTNPPNAYLNNQVLTELLKNSSEEVGPGEYYGSGAHLPFRTVQKCE